VSVALIIKHERRMRLIIMPRVVCLTGPHFSTLSHNPYDFREVVIEQKIFVLIFFYNLSQTSHSNNNSARYYPKCTNVFM